MTLSFRLRRNFTTRATASSITTTTSAPSRPVIEFSRISNDDPSQGSQPTLLVQPPFDVNALSGFLSTCGRIDRDVSPHDCFRLPLVASDHGNKTLTRTTTVLVCVGDINDYGSKVADTFALLKVKKEDKSQHSLYWPLTVI